jgi:lysophospholipase L1-like esterase
MSLASLISKRMVQMAAQPNRYIPAHVEAFQYPLPKFAAQLTGSGSIKIVAIGSSSTAAEGDIVPYPYRLQTSLRAKYPNRMIDVLNRGIGGQEAPDELARMRDDVIAESPSLTIWQVGTNAVWQPGHNLDDVAAAIANGLKLLGGEAMDVILMDLQYAPAVLTEDKIEATRRMLSLIDQRAAAAKVNVFHRFEMMRRFVDDERHSFDTIIDPTDTDRLHQSDFSARRIGYELCEAIAAAAAPGGPAPAA